MIEKKKGEKQRKPEELLVKSYNKNLPHQDSFLKLTFPLEFLMQHSIEAVTYR